MTVGLSRTAIFSGFAGYFSVTLEMRPALLYIGMQSVGFSIIPKCVTLNDLKRLFRVKLFSRRFGWLCEFRKIIA